MTLGYKEDGAAGKKMSIGVEHRPNTIVHVILNLASTILPYSLSLYRTYPWPPHLKIRAPQDRPAPKPEQATMSPGLTLPSFTASSRAKGMDPALVLPYFLRFDRIFFEGMLSLDATASMMRVLA